MTQALRIRRLLEQDITSGTLKAGDKLDESVLAKRYGVSRTPVREALMQLQAVDLVERRPKSGAVVKGRTLKILVATLELHRGLETMAAQLAARRATPRDFAKIRKAFDASVAIAAVGDADLYYDANCEFHYSIYSASHNEVLFRTASSIGESLMPFFRAQHHTPGWIDKTIADHAEILQAIENRDVNAIADLVGRHVHFDSEQFADLAAQFD